VQSVLNIEGNGRCEVKEPGVVGTSCTNVPSISSHKDPEGMESMRELNQAIFLHMFTLPKNEMGDREYMGITSHGSIEPEKERVFIKAKGVLYLDEQRSKFRERIYSFVIGVIVGIIAASFSAWIQGQIKVP